MAVMEWRRLRPGESDPERLFGIGLFLCWLAAAVLVVLVLPPEFVPSCRFRRATGFPCPTCGSSRAFVALLRGRPWEALARQPLVVLGSGAFALYSLYAWTVVLGRLPRLRGLPPIRWRRLLPLLALLVAVNWLHLVLRHL